MKAMLCVALTLFSVSAMAQNFSDATDKRCKFKHSVNGNMPKDVDWLFKKAHSSYAEYQSHDAPIIDAWMNVVSRGGKPRRQPKLILGFLIPMLKEPKGTYPNTRLPQEMIYEFLGFPVVFVGTKSVPCGMVLIKPIKTVGKDGILIFDKYEIYPKTRDK